eukprot:986607-Pleurochrysis_carterae.AAC.1
MNIKAILAGSQKFGCSTGQEPWPFIFCPRFEARTKLQLRHNNKAVCFTLLEAELETRCRQYGPLQ